MLLSGKEEEFEIWQAAEFIEKSNVEKLRVHPIWPQLGPMQENPVHRKGKTPSRTLKRTLKGELHSNF
jgi:hypothetical protein